MPKKGYSRNTFLGKRQILPRRHTSWTSGCETWTDIKRIDACEQYVIGLRSNGSVVMAGKMESRDCHPGVYAEGRHETTYVNFSEDGQLDTWTDMVYIDASGQFILGIHADGSPDMIGSYRYNSWRASMQAAWWCSKLWRKDQPIKVVAPWVLIKLFFNAMPILLEKVEGRWWLFYPQIFHFKMIPFQRVSAIFYFHAHKIRLEGSHVWASGQVCSAFNISCPRDFAFKF